MMEYEHLSESILSEHAWSAGLVNTCNFVEGHEGDVDAETKINEYTLTKKLGSGSFAQVYMCNRVPEEEGNINSRFRQFAVKKMSKSFLRKQKEMKTIDGKLQFTTALDKVLKEYDTMKHLFHKNIMLLYEMINDDNHDNLYFILELWRGGPSMEWNDENKTFMCPETGENTIELGKVQKYIADIASGLAYLKQQGILHRDIKPSNILLNKERNKCVIIDFGCAKILQNPSNPMVSDTDGTIAFFSPEACAAEGPYDGYATDVWALGVTLYAFVVGKLPFYSLNIAGLLDVIIKEPLQFPSEVRLPDLLKQLLVGMLDKSESTRLTIEGVLEHPWIAPFVTTENRPIVSSSLFESGDKSGSTRYSELLKLCMHEKENISGSAMDLVPQFAKSFPELSDSTCDVFKHHILEGSSSKLKSKSIKSLPKILTSDSMRLTVLQFLSSDLENQELFDLFKSVVDASTDVKTALKILEIALSAEGKKKRSRLFVIAKAQINKRIGTLESLDAQNDFASAIESIAMDTSPITNQDFSLLLSFLSKLKMFKQGVEGANKLLNKYYHIVGMNVEDSKIMSPVKDVSQFGIALKSSLSLFKRISAAESTTSTNAPRLFLVYLMNKVLPYTQTFTDGENNVVIQPLAELLTLPDVPKTSYLQLLPLIYSTLKVQLSSSIDNDSTTTINYRALESLLYAFNLLAKGLLSSLPRLISLSFQGSEKFTVQACDEVTSEQRAAIELEQPQFLKSIQLLCTKAESDVPVLNNELISINSNTDIEKGEKIRQRTDIRITMRALRNVISLTKPLVANIDGAGSKLPNVTDVRSLGIHLSHLPPNKPSKKDNSKKRKSTDGGGAKGKNNDNNNDNKKKKRKKGGKKKEKSSGTPGSAWPLEKPAVKSGNNNNKNKNKNKNKKK